MFTDIRNATFDEMIIFYFDNPYSVERPTDWSNYLQFDYDPTHNARFFIQLFENSTVLLEKYDATTINKGIWLLSSVAFDGNVYDVVLEDQTVPFDLKQSCVRAMYNLFKDLFAVEPVEGSAFWWNKFAGYRNGRAWTQGEPAQLADTIFETLLNILGLESDYRRSCALDGIAKLRHRNTGVELKAFLRQHNRMKAEERAMIRKVIDANPPFPI